MKKKIIPLVVLLGTMGAYAQIGVGTTLPHESAELEVSSEKKGVLIPRLALTSETDKTTIVNGSQIESLLVYHTGTPELVAGFYFWASDKWNAIVSNSTLYKYVQETVKGNVTYKEGKFYVTITDGNGGTTTEEIDIEKMIKDNTVVAKLDITPATENANNVKAGFVFNDGKTGSVDKAFAETLTTLESADITVYVYMDFVDGNYLEMHENVERPADEFGVKPTPLRTYVTKKFVYTNEKEDKVEFKGSDLFGGTGAEKTNETVTKLEFQSNYDGSNRKALVYTDENRIASPIYVDELFKQGETLTSLNVDYDTRKMTYIDEAQTTNEFDLDLLVKQPWLTTDGKAATANGQDMYAMGWVGIGVKARTGAPNERLSVDGSITATNSYYADYVFEKYFDGYSSLKYDYNFKDLNSVNNFIKENRHLPGITPISELTKTDTGYAFNVSELSIQLLEKTEELFLHVIEQQKELNAKETRIEKLESEVSDMTKRLQALEALLIK